MRTSQRCNVPWSMKLWWDSVYQSLGVERRRRRWNHCKKAKCERRSFLFTIGRESSSCTLPTPHEENARKGWAEMRVFFEVHAPPSRRRGQRDLTSMAVRPCVELFNRANECDHFSKFRIRETWWENRNSIYSSAQHLIQRWIDAHAGLVLSWLDSGKRVNIFLFSFATWPLTAPTPRCSMRSLPFLWLHVQVFLRTLMSSSNFSYIPHSIRHLPRLLRYSSACPPPSHCSRREYCYEKEVGISILVLLLWWLSYT